MSSIGRQSCEIMKENHPCHIMKENHPCHTELCAFRRLISIPQILNLRSRNQIRGKLFLSRSRLRYFMTEGAISHIVLYHQKLPVTRYQLSFYTNNYFKKLPTVSTAFKNCLSLFEYLGPLITLSQQGKIPKL